MMMSQLLLKQIQHLGRISERNRQSLEAHRRLMEEIAKDKRSPYAQQAQEIIREHESLMEANRPDREIIQALGGIAESSQKGRYSVPHRAPRRATPEREGWLQKIGSLLP